MSTRRGRGEGSYEQLRSKRWRAIISAGHDPVTGKRLRETYTADTKRECLTWLAEQRTKTPGCHAGKITLGSWLVEWLAQKRGKVEPRTYKFHVQQSRLRITPTIGPVRLSKLTARDVSNMHAQLTARGASPDAQSKAATTLRAALSDAVEQKLIAVNVAKQVRRPRVVKREIHAMSQEEAAAFLQAALGDYLVSYFDLALDSGARPGELCALHWPEFHESSGEISIVRNLEEIDGEFRLKPPKTRAGRRRILLASRTVASLAAHRERMAILGRDVKRGAVFLGKNSGTWLWLRNVSRGHFNPILERAGLSGRGIRPYDLRHTSATLLLSRGVSVKVVSERLGHEDVGVTLRYYAGILAGMQEKARDVMNDLFPAKPILGLVS